MHVRFGPYTLLRSIGSGELGEVFVAEGSLAVKRIGRRDRAYADRFHQRTQAAGAIDHPNIIPLYDAGTIDGTLYTASELIPGADLAVIAARLRDRNVGAPAAIGHHILSHAIAALNALGGTPHGGLPRNLILGWDGITRLSDLGPPRNAKVSDTTGVGLALYRLYTGSFPSAPLAELRPDLPHTTINAIHHLISGPGTLPDLEPSTLEDRDVAAWLEDLYRRPGFIDAQTPKVWLREASTTEADTENERSTVHGKRRHQRRDDPLRPSDVLRAHEVDRRRHVA